MTVLARTSLKLPDWISTTQGSLVVDSSTQTPSLFREEAQFQNRSGLGMNRNVMGLDEA
jgi:hypothetical protein